MSEIHQTQLEAAIAAALPEHLRERAGELAAAILSALQNGSHPVIDPEVLRALSGTDLRVDGRLIDFGTGNQFGDIRIRDVVGGNKYEITLAVANEPWRISEEDVNSCPYPGLAVFSAEQSAYFFGRNSDIARLIRQPYRPIVAVTGPSGVGKSSFVLAGVLPKLRADDITLETVHFRISTDTNLLQDLATTLAARTGRPTEELLTALNNDGSALRTVMLSFTSGRSVLVLDQFEELFVGTDESRSADRAKLLDMLLDIECEADPRFLVILTSRENYFEHPDYLGRPELRTIIVERGVPLAGLTDLQLREAILGPLDAFNKRPERTGKPALAFENGLINLVEQEFRRTERTLPLVQYLLRLMWTEQRELSKGAYTTLGGLERALDRHASKIYDHFDAETQRLARAVLLALVRPGLDKEYTRRRVSRDELVGNGNQRERIIALISRLSSPDSRLISEQQVGQVSYLELTHEILLRQWERLRVLIDTYRERLETREQLLPMAEQWRQSLERSGGRGDTSLLYRGSQIRDARKYLYADGVVEEIDTGIKSCYLASVRHQRRQRVVAVVGTMITVAVLGIGLNWFTADQRARLAAEQQLSSQRATAQVVAQQTAQAEAIQRGTAEALAGRRAAESQSLRLANQARQLLAQGNRPLAVTLALEANSIENPPLQAQLSLAEVAYAPGYVRDLEAPPAVDGEACVFETTAGPRTIRVEDRPTWTFVLYDAASNARLRSVFLSGINGNPGFPDADGQFQYFWCPPISPDGAYALLPLMIPMMHAGGEGFVDGTLHLWDLRSGEIVRSFPDFAGEAAFSPNGALIAYGTLDNNIRIWAITTERELVAASRARQPLFWSPSGELLLTAGTAEGEVSIFGVDLGGAVEQIRWSGAGVPAGFSPDSASAYIQNGSRLQEWNLSNAAQLTGSRAASAFRAGGLVGVQSIAVSGATERVLAFNTGPDSGRLLISEPRDFEQYKVVSVPGHEDGLSYTFPVISGDGRFVLTTGRGDVYLLDVESGQSRLLSVPNAAPGNNGLALSSDGSRALIATSDTDRPIALLHLNGGTPALRLGEAGRAAIQLQFNPAGDQAAALHGDADVYSRQEDQFRLSVWDVDSGRLRYELDLGTGPPPRNEMGFTIPSARFAFSRDGARLATAINGKNLQLWDAAGAALWSVPAAGEVVAFSPDDSLIANGRPGGEVRLLATADGSLQTTLVDATAPFIFSPDGTLIATAGIDSNLRVFDVASGAEVRRFADAARDIIFHPDGRSLFTGGEAGVRRWRIDTLAELIAWTRANRSVAPLSCEQRALYQVPPLCPPGTTATVDPTRTEAAIARPTATAAPLPTTAMPENVPAPLDPREEEAIVAALNERIPTASFSIGSICIDGAFAIATLTALEGTVEPKIAILRKRESTWGLLRFDAARDGDLSDPAYRVDNRLPFDFACLDSVIVIAGAPTVCTGTTLDSLPAFADILEGQLVRDGSALQATLRVRDLPATLPYNNPALRQNTQEYRWGVAIYLDTSETSTDRAGRRPDYEIAAARFIRDNREPAEGPITEFVVANLWEKDGERLSTAGGVALRVDTETDMITLDAYVPKLPDRFMAVFSTYVHDGTGPYARGDRLECLIGGSGQ